MKIIKGYEGFYSNGDEQSQNALEDLNRKIYHSYKNGFTADDAVEALGKIKTLTPEWAQDICNRSQSPKVYKACLTRSDVTGETIKSILFSIHNCAFESVMPDLIAAIAKQDEISAQTQTNIRNTVRSNPAFSSENYKAVDKALKNTTQKSLRAALSGNTKRKLRDLQHQRSLMKNADKKAHKAKITKR
jgi:hypothetical protein